MFSMIPFRSNNRVANRNENYYNPFSDDFFRAFFGDDFADGVLKLTLPKEKAQQKLSGRTIEIQ